MEMNLSSQRFRFNHLNIICFAFSVSFLAAFFLPSYAEAHIFPWWQRSCCWVFFLILVLQRVFIVFFLKKRHGWWLHIIWYLTISTPVPQANLVSIGKDLLLVQKQLPDTVSIYIYLYFLEEASMKIPIFYLTFWIKSHPMSFPLWSNDIAKHRQTSEGFAQGPEHGETYRNRLLEKLNVWVKPKHAGKNRV